MRTHKIRLRVDEVKDFVAAATRCDFDIDICYNRYVIDAKSFLGVYGLDFTKPLTVSYDGYNGKFDRRCTRTGSESDPYRFLQWL